MSPESSSLSCLLGWNPSLNRGPNILSFNYYRLSRSPGSSHLLACWVGIPVRLVLMVPFNYELYTACHVLVQRAPVSLVSLVGIPVYLVVIVSSHDRLKYQSREL